MNFKKIDLKKGFVQIYENGDMKLHTYQTEDVMNDECFILENSDNLLLIEFPSFYDDIEIFKEYVESLNKPVIGKVFSDHPSGGNEYKDVKSYASAGTIKSIQEGEIYHIVEGFKDAFNGAFASEFHKIIDVLKDSKVNIGGFDLELTYHEQNVEIVIPVFNAVYTHMLGSDTHTIIPSMEYIDAFINQLEQYISKNYDLILSSHHTPETLDDVKIKIDYLKNIKEIATNSETKDEFKEKVNNKYPNYKGLNYLDMTADNLFN